MLSSSSGSEEITKSSSTTTTTTNTSKTTTTTTTTKTRSDYSSNSSSKSSLSSVPRTMEEVWKDINLSSLHDMNISSSDPNTNPTTPPFPHMNRSSVHHQNNFQDFLARPFGNNNTNDQNLAKTMVQVSSMPSPSTSLNHSATALSLNSGPDHQFGFLDHNPLNHYHHHHHNHNHHHHHDQIISRPTSMMISNNPNSNVSSYFTNTNNSPFESPLLSFGKKRFPCDNNSGGSGDNRRHKRMIKNRESAARSRARKQAYTNELELEVAHLMEENQRLRKQQEQFCQAAAAQLPKKHSLQRTSTAPF